MVNQKSTQIRSPELAWEMARAEKTHMEKVVEGGRSEEEVHALRRAANLAGIAAARQYIQELQENVNWHDDTIPNYEDETFQAKLSIPIEELLLGSHLPQDEAMANRTSRQLRLQKVHTLRDLLLLGKNEVKHMRNIGDRSLNLIDDSIHAELGDSVVWPDKKTIDLETIAKLCTSLDQVPLSLVGIRIEASNYLGKESEEFIYLRDVIDTPDEKLAYVMRDKDKLNQEEGGTERGAPNFVKADRVKTQAREVARRFASLRAERQSATL